MDLGGHEEESPIPITAQYSAATIQETAAKLKLLASAGNGTPVPQVGAGALVPVPQVGSGVAVAGEGDAANKTKPRLVRFRECLKNHAAGIGGNSLDGCGEFMPSGEEGTLEALKCAACGCHRNFHRKEVEGESSGCVECHHRRDKKRLLQSLARGGEPDEQAGYAVAGPNMKKRFRTKFTADQKEKMFAFAERVGWKIQKHDEADVQQFCNEIGVKRHVLKVWMHNNKHTLGNKKM